MNIPNYRESRVRVLVDRYFLSFLVDTDGAALVDTDDTLLGVTPLVRTPTEITDRVRSGRVNLGDVSAVGSSHAGVDSAVTVLSLTLDHGEPSLAPGVPSSLNEPDELLRPYRAIRVIGEDGVNPPITLFSGYLGDEIRSTASAGGATLSLTARDLAKPLQDLFISEWPLLAADASDATPVPVDDVLGEILALVPAHLRPQLDVLSPVTLSVREPYRPQNVSVWDAMQQVAIQSGWYLGVLGESLVFLDPPRDKVTPDVVLDTDDAYTDDLGISDTDVRNVVQVAYTDAATRERVVIEERDQWSIDNITGGIEKRSIIELDETSQIDSAPEAEALASAFISDMSREFASTQLNLPFLPSLWLFDVVQMTHEKFTSLPRVFAVHSVQHTFDRARNRTVVAGVGQVIGKRRAWLNREPRPGSPSDPRGPHQSVLPPPIVTVAQGNPGISVTIDQKRGVDAEWVQIFMSTTPGFIPSGDAPGQGTLVAEGTQENWVFASTDVSDPAHIIPGVWHYIRVRCVDSLGTPGRFTAQMSIMPARVEGALITLDGNVNVTGDFHVQGENVTIDGDTTFGGNIIVRGPSGGNTGTLHFQNNAGSSLLRIGNVGGFAGAPAGAVGLAGALGTGIWIEGAPRLITLFSALANTSPAFPMTLTAGATSSFTGLTSAIIAAPFTVPAGKVWVIMPLLTEFQIYGGGFANPVVVKPLNIMPQMGTGGIPTLTITAGTWTQPVVIRASGELWNRLSSTVTLTSYDYRVSGMVFEVDA